MVKILKPNSIDPYLRDRLQIKGMSHKIMSSSPFLAQIRAVQGLKWYSSKQLILCTINLQGTRTILKIESASFQRHQAFDGYIHKDAINKIYGELRFQLDSTEKPKLDEVLPAEEKIINQFYPIEYQAVHFDCIITQSRLLLSRNKLIFAEITSKRIHDISLGKEWNKNNTPYITVGALISIIFGSMTLIFLLLGTSFGLLFSIVNLPFIIFGGIAPLIVGMVIDYNYYLLIQTMDNSFKIYSKKPTLIAIENMLTGMVTGRRKVIETKPLEFQKEQEEPIKVQKGAQVEKTCFFCGSKNSNKDDFCVKCGASI